MAFDISKFMEGGLKFGGARSSLFNVVFDEADERLQYLTSQVTISYGLSLPKVEFVMLEDEDQIVRNNLHKLAKTGVKITEYNNNGDVLHITTGTFHYQEATTTLNWGDYGIKTWIVKGRIE